MLRAFIPDGADGNGRWLKQELDAAFNQSSRGSMCEFVARHKDATVIEYAKTIKMTSKSFQAGWEQVWLVNYEMGTQVITGPEMKLLLEAKFMEPGLWEVLHARIGEWAVRLAKAGEDQGLPACFLDDLHRGGSIVFTTASREDTSKVELTLQRTQK